MKSRNDGISGRSSCEGNVCGTKKVVAIDAGIVEAVFVVGTVKREGIGMYNCNEKLHYYFK